MAIKEALLKEAANWLTNDHSVGDWCMHCTVEPSDDLITAFQSVEMGGGDVDDDEEYEDAMELLMVEVFNEVGEKT